MEPIVSMKNGDQEGLPSHNAFAVPDCILFITSCCFLSKPDITHNTFLDYINENKSTSS